MRVKGSLVRKVPGIPGMVTRMTARELHGDAPAEHAEAVRFFRVVSLHEAAHPDLQLLYAVPNGGLRNKVVAAKMRAEGQRPGVPDYCWPRRSACGSFAGLYIELKRQKGGRLADEQRKFLDGVRAQGYRAERADGWEQAWRLVCEHGGWPCGL